MSHPAPWIFLNGRFISRSEASYPLEDRGTLFSDGAYEVLRYVGGKAFEGERHLQRLRRGLAGIDLDADIEDLLKRSAELMSRNQLPDGKAYWQVTRGAASRTHHFPSATAPTVLLLAYPAPPLENPGQVLRRSAVLAEDNRWSDCWIKSMMLLPNVLALERARAAGAEDAIFVRASDGSAGMPIRQRVTETTAGNLFIVEKGTLRTHPADRWILPGITREVVLEEAGRLNLPASEKPFSPETLLQAEEVFLTSTTAHVTAITHVDGKPIADGNPGPVTSQLHRQLLRRMAAATPQTP